MSRNRERFVVLFLEYLEILGLIGVGLFFGWLFLGSPAAAKSNGGDVMSVNVYTHSALLKKWFVSESKIREHEAKGLKASDILQMEDDSRSWSKAIAGDAVNVPPDEFRSLVYELPDFTDLPILWSAWCSLDRPVEFVAQCIETSDTIFIDTSGYHYARYRAACKFDKKLV